MAIAAVVVIAAVVLGVTVFSGSSLPVLNASYKCVPGPLIPQLKAGESGTMSTTYGGFTATFRATLPASTPANWAMLGMPFKGTLTVTQGGQSWTLPRPANPNDSEINVMCVIAFQREQDPGVMVEGFTGGAHCCEVPVIYLFDHADNRYVKVLDMSPNHYQDPHAFDDNEGFIPTVVGRHVLLQTGDDQFAYAFGCYACSELPLVLDAVSPGGLTDVTPQYPALVAANARAIWKNALDAVRAESDAGPSNIPAPFGFLAPWVADECTLGSGATAWSAILRLELEGKLSDALYFEATTNHGSFVAHLRAFLLRDDYCTGQI